MSTLDAFLKECPADFSVDPEPRSATSYKYYLRGKGATLGVLFENSTHLFFEWVLEEGRPVSYRPELRYKAWPKHRVADWLRSGLWEIENEQPAPIQSGDSVLR